MRVIVLTPELQALQEKTFECSDHLTILSNLKVFIRAVEADLSVKLTPSERIELLKEYEAKYLQEMCLYGV